jgi:hypothetical protein
VCLVVFHSLQDHLGIETCGLDRSISRRCKKCRHYVSASDTEDDLALQTNHAGDLADDDDEEQVFGSEHMT